MPIDRGAGLDNDAPPFSNIRPRSRYVVILKEPSHDETIIILEQNMTLFIIWYYYYITMAKLNILYVDDEPELLDITKMLLEQDSELKVNIEQDPIVAINRIARDEYDVIVSDYQMSGMSGIELLKEVRKLDHVPFILFTGRGREEVAIEALNNGADFYLQKGGNPHVQFEELKNAIMQLARRKGMEDQRRVAEQALRESENKLRDIFNSVNDAIFIHDMEGHFLEVNDVVCTRLGYSRDELLRRRPRTSILQSCCRCYEYARAARAKGHIVYKNKLHRQGRNEDTYRDLAAGPLIMRERQPSWRSPVTSPSENRPKKS